MKIAYSEDHVYNLFTNIRLYLKVGKYNKSHRVLVEDRSVFPIRLTSRVGKDTFMGGLIARTSYKRRKSWHIWS